MFNKIKQWWQSLTGTQPVVFDEPIILAPIETVPLVQLDEVAPKPARKKRKQRQRYRGKKSNAKV